MLDGGELHTTRGSTQCTTRHKPETQQRTRAPQERAQRQPREDVHVVGLAGPHGGAVDHHVGLRAAGGEDGAALRHLDGVLAGALHLGDGVGHGEDDGPLAVGAHLGQNLRVCAQVRWM